MNTISRLVDLSIGYRKDHPILENCNLTIRTGEICALLGPNGSGKSTLIRTWSGLIQKISGRIESIHSLNFSLVPQVKNINFGFPMTVKDTLLLPKKAKTFYKKVEFTSFEENLIEKSGLTNLLSKQLSECSGGQLQKVLIVRSLISNAGLIFLDEPMDALDPASTESMFGILEFLKKERNTSFFLITHNVSSESISRFDRIFKVITGTIEENK